jgi:hypothetical protein
MSVDHDNAAIEAARRVQSDAVVQYSFCGTECTVQLPSGARPDAVVFRQADPMSLPAEFIGFQVAVLNDVLDKLASPGALLGRLGGVRGLLAPRGVLVIISAYDWNENCTPKSLWLGGSHGREDNFEGLCAKLSTLGFKYLHKQDMLKLEPRNNRAFEGHVYEASVFLRVN